MMYPQYPYQMHPYYAQPYHPTGALKTETLTRIEPFVRCGLQEAKFTSHAHALREVAAISYLLGKGYDPRTAHRIVESWEVDEKF